MNLAVNGRISSCQYPKTLSGRRAHSTFRGPANATVKPKQAMDARKSSRCIQEGTLAWYARGFTTFITNGRPSPPCNLQPIQCRCRGCSQPDCSDSNGDCFACERQSSHLPVILVITQGRPCLCTEQLDCKATEDLSPPYGSGLPAVNPANGPVGRTNGRDVG